LLEFSDRNRIPYRWLDPRDPDDASSIATCGSPEGAPFRVVLGKRRVLDRPTPQQFARAIGLDLDVKEDRVCDLRWTSCAILKVTPFLIACDQAPI
jgi:thioredoxin reductase (NADPH)